MRVYSVLLAVTIAFLANSAAGADDPDQAGVSKLLRSENTDRRLLAIGLDPGEQIPELGELAEELMRTDVHVEEKMRNWCHDVKDQLKKMKLLKKHKGSKAEKMEYSTKKNDQLLRLEILYKEYMMAKGLTQKKIKCKESE